MSNDIKTTGINKEMAMDATDLTQLSSREQLSALMDGALPADETRFLLRRLQHDDSLAECWERWRLSAEVMRGLAPTQRLPADFASRVAASLRGEDNEYVEEYVEPHASAVRTPAWLRWGGGAAVAASLAVVAFMTQPVVMQAPGNLPDHTVVAATDAAQALANGAVVSADEPGSRLPAPQSPAQDPAGAGLESKTAALASVVAVAAARPARNNRRGNEARAYTKSSVADAAVREIDTVAVNEVQPLPPPTDITSRPWPRSVLPQYANSALTVGFGNNMRNTAPHNPFRLRTGIGNLAPALIVEQPAGDAPPPVNDAPGRTVDGQPQS